MALKVLVIRFSSIGDIILCSPVVRALHEQLGAEVHFLTKARFGNLFENNPHISKVYVLEDSMGEVITELSKEKYDHIIDLHNNLRSHRVTLSLRRPTRRYYKQTIEKLLLLYTRVNRLSDSHVVDRYMDTIQHLGARHDGKGLDFHVSDTSYESVDMLKKKPYVVLAIGATHYTKRMTPEVAIRLISEIQYPIIILGGKDTSTLRDDIMAYEIDKEIHDYVGKTSIDESARIIKESLYVVTGDSAMMHIAAALKKPILSVWGSTHPCWGYAPYYGDGKDISVPLQRELRCRPCSKTGGASCPKEHFLCMKHEILSVKNSLYMTERMLRANEEKGESS